MFKTLFNLNKLSSIIFYLSMLTFIIAFNFAHNPLSGWYQQFLPNLNGRQVTDITFLDSLNGFAVTNNLTPGDTGYILKTTNGGDNWNFSFIVNRGFTTISFVNENTGYACGGSGGGTTYLCKTIDAGLNWFLVNSPSAAKWNDMSVLNNDTLWLVDTDGLTGGVFRTTNGGATWDRQLNLGSQNPESIYFFNKEIGFISHNIGARYIRKTTNSGENWFEIVNNEGYNDIFFVDSLKGWRSHGNNVYLTTNGGSNWITQILPSGGIILSTGINKFSNINSDTIWGAGGSAFYGSGQFRSIIYKTINGGNNWLYQIPDTSIHSGTYRHIQFVDKIKGWAYWVFGGIHTVIGGDTTFTSIREMNSGIPVNFDLYQNYPNPFNPKTVIKYQIKNARFVNLRVFDITGKQITDLVNKKQNAGTYEVDFFGDELTSGIYFYSLFIDEVMIDTKKMLLLK